MEQTGDSTLPKTEKKAFRIRRRYVRVYTGVAVMAGLLAVIAIIWGIWNWFYAFSHYGPIVVWKWSAGPLWVGFVLGIIALVSALVSIHARRHLVVVHSAGVDDNRWWRRCHLKWEEVVGIRTNSEQFGLSGVAFSRRATVWLVPIRGRSVRFSTALEGLEDFTEMIKSYLYPGLLVQYRDSLGQDQILEFGPVQITKREIVIAGTHIQWDQVVRVELEKGRLTIYSGDEGRTKHSVAAKKVLNVDLVLQLIQNMEFKS